MFARRGIVPEAVSSFLLPQVVGLSRAIEWTATGRIFGALEALGAGLVRSLHPADQLLAAALALVSEISDNTSPVAVAAAVVAFVCLFCAVFANVVAPYNPFNLATLELSDAFLPPAWIKDGSARYLLGTDDQGRDILSRLIHGSRITLYVVVLVAVLAAPIGLLVGTVSGYAGGWLDAVLMRITDIFLAFPRLILALAFVAALGPGIGNAVIAIAITSWPPYARIARAETLTIRQADYISAVRLLGASPWRIVLRHVMPLCVASVIVRVTLDMAGIILTAAGLGFLGLGAQPPAPEWGAMIANGRQFVLDQWWVAAAPGAAICIVSLAFNLLGDGLRDALDPKDSQ